MKTILVATMTAAALALATTSPFAQTEPPGSTEQPQQQKHPVPEIKKGAPGTTGNQGQPAGNQNHAGPNAQVTPQEPGAPGQQTPGTQGQTKPTQRKAVGVEQPNREKDATNGQGPQGRPQNAQAPSGHSMSRPLAAISSEQRNRIHERASVMREHRLDRVEFRLAVGVVLPRTVVYYPVPPEIVEIVPEYSGYDYNVVGDELIILDPASLLIVAIIPV
jgi:hypothetical protein